MFDEIDPQHSNNIWLGGDFNVPNVDWSDVMSTPNSPNTQLATKLIEVTNDRSLTQVVDLPTRKDNTLDLFFTSNPSLINRTITIPPLTQAADHDIVFIDVNTRASIPKQTPATKFLYKKADWASMRQEMSNYVPPHHICSGTVERHGKLSKIINEEIYPNKSISAAKNTNLGLQEKLLTTYIEETNISKHGEKRNLKIYIIPTWFNGPFASRKLDKHINNT